MTRVTAAPTFRQDLDLSLLLLSPDDERESAVPANARASDDTA